MVPDQLATQTTHPTGLRGLHPLNLLD